jgi:hypothetical protein
MILSVFALERFAAHAGRSFDQYRWQGELPLDHTVETVRRHSEAMVGREVLHEIEEILAQ